MIVLSSALLPYSPLVSTTGGCSTRTSTATTEPRKFVSKPSSSSLTSSLTKCTSCIMQALKNSQTAAALLSSSPVCIRWAASSSFTPFLIAIGSGGTGKRMLTCTCCSCFVSTVSFVSPFVLYASLLRLILRLAFSFWAVCALLFVFNFVVFVCWMDVPQTHLAISCFSARLCSGVGFIDTPLCLRFWPALSLRFQTRHIDIATTSCSTLSASRPSDWWFLRMIRQLLHNLIVLLYLSCMSRQCFN